MALHPDSAVTADSSIGRRGPTATLRSVSPPEPMLSTSARRWPSAGEWVLQPKWDGFRLLIEVGADRRMRAWSRHGTSLTGRLGGLMEAFAETPAGSLFDGELVAVSEREGRPVQDFATVGRAVLRGDIAAAESLRFVGFDLLALAGEDLRGRQWRERDRRLAEALPVCGLVRRIESRPALPAAHAAIVELGFEGTVLKRPTSVYRPGRHGVGSSTRPGTRPTRCCWRPAKTGTARARRLRS